MTTGRPPRYSVAQTFLRREAVPGNAAVQNVRGGARNEPADPYTLQVLLVNAATPTRAVEQIQVPHERIRRLYSGTWAYELPQGLIVQSTYIVNWIYQFQGGNPQTTFQQVTFTPVPERPSRPDHCVLYGMLSDSAGLPYGNQRIVIERYVDVVTLNRRVDAPVVTSDAFGMWYLELPVGQVVRVVFGELTKVIQIPQLDRAALSAIPEYQPTSTGRVDAFGYPLPGMDHDEVRS